jgi:hypothetical protein
MGKISQEMEDDYEEFLVEIPMLLEDLQTLLSRSRNYKDVKVNYDSDTLDRIESFYLDVLDEKEKVDVSRARLNRIIIAFFGDSLIQRAGGVWMLDDVENDRAFGTPVVINWAKGGAIRFSPVERRELLIKNRKPFLRDFIEYAVNKEKFEEDLLKKFD